ncbi:hypothetical protein HID58_060976 [Brassica napus]|uniref:Defensin n=1 Tax=Brassica napus TaxID=3708 RepID=A0ABQ7ZXA2_BRANA|nr:hypothetical protein HID58_060976 [Brassica napus]
MHRRICLRLCKESARKTGFRRGTCTVKDNNHYCHCYNHVCAPPQPPRKGPPPPFGEDKDTSNCGGVHGVDYLTVTGVPPSG